MHDCLLDLEVKLVTGFFLENFDFVKTLLLGLGEISGRTLEILAFFSLAKLSLAKLLIVLDFIVFTLNCKAMHYLKDLLSLLAINLSHPDCYKTFLTLTIFFCSYLFFPDFISFSFDFLESCLTFSSFLFQIMKRHMTVVTWHITWWRHHRSRFWWKELEEITSRYMLTAYSFHNIL